jgi:hypothetical protein
MTTFEGKNSREHIDGKPKKIYEIIITIAKLLLQGCMASIYE